MRGKKPHLLFIVTAVLCAAFLLCIISYIAYLKKTLENEARTYLSDSSHLGASYINERISDIIEDLTDTADSISKNGDIFSPDTADILKAKAKRTKFCQYSVVDLSGSCNTRDGHKNNIADEAYFKKAIAGEANISPVIMPCRYLNKKAIIFAVPIEVKGNVVGVLRAHLDEANFSEFFAVPSFGHGGYSAIADHNGDVLAQPYAEGDTEKHVLPPNIFSAVKGVQKLEKEGMMSGSAAREGLLRYTYKEDLRYLYYTPIGINGWQLISIIPYSALSDRFAGFTKLTYIASIFMFVFFMGAAIAIVVTYGRKTREIQHARQKMAMMAENIPGGVVCCSADKEMQIKEVSDGYLSLLECSDKKDLDKKFAGLFINTVHIDDREMVAREAEAAAAAESNFLLEMEYRLAGEREDEVWVLCRGRVLNDWNDERCFYCIVVDITKSRLIQDELALSEERHRIITETAEESILDWDAVKKKMYYSPKYRETFAEFNTDVSIIDGLLAEDRIYKDDVAGIIEFLDSLTEGKVKKRSTEARALTLNGTYAWFRIDAAAITDSKGKMIRLLAMLKNIDASMKEKLTWKHKAQTDSLTGLYDKGMTENLIAEYLSGEGESSRRALFVVDIDNFKGINDRFGHPFGDTVLAETASALKGLFGEDDIVGRIGGDEFMVLLKNINGMGPVCKRAIDLCSIFSRTFGNADEEDAVHVSGSVGIAFYPEHGENYETLFQNADTALYSAKRSGKNRYIVYSDDIKDTFDSEEIAVMHTEILPEIPEGQKPFADNFAEYIFRILYTSDNPHEAIRLCLGMACRKIDVSRAYIFEYNDNFTEMNCTYEWCQTGFSSLIDKYQNYPVEKLPSYTERFASSDVFYIDVSDALDKRYYSVLHEENVKSMVQCALTEGGVLKGYVGFDECVKEKRIPTDSELSQLTFLAKILGTFLAKERSRYALEKVNIFSEALLDIIQQWVYVVDGETFEFVYVNRGLREYFPGAVEQSKCYHVLKGMSTVCENCPITTMKKENLENLSLDMSFPGKNIATPLTVTKIIYKGSPLYMITLNNISEIKKTNGRAAHKP